MLRLTPYFDWPAVGAGGASDGYVSAGGLTTQVLRLTRGLSALGIEQTVLTLRMPGGPAEARLDERTVVRGVTAPTLGRPGSIRRHLQWLAGIAGPLGTLRDHDVVHAHTDCTPWPALGALLAARRTGLPLVATIHCSSLATYEPVSRRDAQVQRLARRAERGVARRATPAFALTRRAAGVIARRAGLPEGAVQAMPDCLDVGAFRAAATPEAASAFAQRHGVPTDRPVVTYVGRVNPDKGWRDLLEVAARLGERAHLLVCGGGEEEAALREEAARRGLDGAVTVTGVVSQREVSAALALAEVFVLASRFEELGSAALEAMAVGVPAVAYDVGGVAEGVVDDVTGLLVPAGDSAALAGAVAALLGDAARRERLGAEGRRRARDHDMGAACRALADVYARAVAR